MGTCSQHRGVLTLEDPLAVGLTGISTIPNQSSTRFKERAGLKIYFRILRLCVASPWGQHSHDQTLGAFAQLARSAFGVALQQPGGNV
jgi:hypothetical protein